MKRPTYLRDALKNAGEGETTNGGGHLPEDCPVTALGCDADNCYYLNASGHLTTLPKKAHSKLVIYGLFGQRYPYLLQHWPKGRDDQGNRVDFKADLAARSLMAACDAEGAWSSDNKVRGPGVWNGEDGELVLHLGDAVEVRGRRERPGRRGRWVYPLAPARKAPAREQQPGGDEGPAAELEGLLGCWSFGRGDLDVRLLLGWIAAATLCGALEWRPGVWLTGRKGAGKSALTGLIRDVLGEDDGCIVEHQPTPAFLRARLNHAALAVLFDESEPSEDNARLNALTDLARLASSGGRVGRATADHGTVSFTVRFMPLFASIIRPPLKSQDLSRLSFLRMQPHGGRTLALPRPDALRLMGRRLQRRMLDAWPSFHQAMAVYGDALVRALPGDRRFADQHATLMAAAHVALHDALPDAYAADTWAERLVEETASDRAEEKAEWQRCIEHMMSSLAPQWRGGEMSDIGRLVAIAGFRRIIDEPGGEPRGPSAAEAEQAARALATMGLRVVPTINPGGKVERDGAGQMVGHLAVANAHATLNGLFRATHWAARSGTAGGWRNALEDAPGVQVSPQPLRFGGATSRCLLVPLDRALGEMEE